MLIGLVFGLLLHYKTNIQLDNINQKLKIIIQAVESKKIKVKAKSIRRLSELHYSFDIENLWKDFKTLFDTKAELDSEFSFNQVATQIRELREGKGVAASALKNFYLRKTNPRKTTVEAIQGWIDKERRSEEEGINSNNNM